jgi:MFS family permease
MLLMVSSIVGNFLYAALAQRLGYRRAIAAGCLFYFAAVAAAYYTPRDYRQILMFWPFIGAASGLFALFTMYMPPLFPTLLRTTGAGFCYNIGRIAAAAGTVFFGIFARVDDMRAALFYTGFIFLPAAAVAWFMPESPHADDGLEPVE